MQWIELVTFVIHTVLNNANRRLTTKYMAVYTEGFVVINLSGLLY